MVQAVRAYASIKKVMFIACDAEKSMTNVFDLCRPSTSKFKGGPFKITRVVAFDMFPGTSQMELVYQLERE